MANYKLNQSGSQIQNDLNLLDSNTATQGQVLTASGNGGSAWQNPPETIYTSGEGININNKVVSINSGVVATKTDLNGKQNTISDLETIRSGAALGSTSLQSIPIASAYVLGGVKIGSGLSIDLEGVLSSTGGSSEPAEYLKKAEINGNTLTIINKDNSTTVYTPDLSNKQDKILPEQTISLVAGENITINNGVVSATDTKYSDATTSTSGLMSSTDKVKLNSLTVFPECPTTTVGDFILKANVPSAGNVNYSWLSYSVYNGEVE